MSTGKLIAFTIAWIFASVTIGVVTAVVITEILVLVGLIETGSDVYDISLNVITFATFLAVASVPFVFRRRFTSEGPDDG